MSLLLTCGRAVSNLYPYFLVQSGRVGLPPLEGGVLKRAKETSGEFGVSLVDSRQGNSPSCKYVDI